jgi:hypothetical protein
MDYDVNFNEAGTYYIHLRTASYQDGANSVKFALDGEVIANHMFTGGGGDNWNFAWATCRGDGAGSRAIYPWSIDIVTPGLHTISIGAREAYISLDLIYLSMSDDDCYRHLSDGEPDTPDAELFLGP